MKVLGQRLSIFKFSLLVFVLFIVTSFLFIYYLDSLWRQTKIHFKENAENSIPEKNQIEQKKQIIVNQIPPFLKVKQQMFEMALDNAQKEEEVRNNLMSPQTTSKPHPHINYNIHIFYYPWYGNPEHDGKYYHWNHPYLPHWEKAEAAKWPSGKHVPPDDIGANYYPQLGPYSSSDPTVVEDHMKQIQLSGAGVLAVSWYPPNDADNEGKQPDKLTPLILDMADKYQLKVAFHIEPFKGRDHKTLKNNIKYIVDTYGKHPAFYRHYDRLKKKLLPVYYIYDSYLVKSSDWAELFSSSGSISIRNTEYDGIFLGLLVERQHKESIASAGFDGYYTYFATDGFTYGSSWKHWREIMKYARGRKMLFVPSVGPGYVDTRVRPWNGKNTRSRQDGQYYRLALQSALDVNPSLVSITSFNEWHEGTQIETAVPKVTKNFTYSDYGSGGPQFYLNLTRQCLSKFKTEDLT
ncbi:glycoprotein endo-alpha-1,2-mannosidase-like [Saccostrea echinata]|uniref:glycoprotein endo-alpha-1,2-mannosidase-like n=1 Tax=Saccostrea echinata TaxID=191078 RepID=UPI002A812B09|nr:glycoprotein endo-alpha-1,2-mannosidase-like [Saccostrea echinata]